MSSFSKYEYDSQIMMTKQIINVIQLNPDLKKMIFSYILCDSCGTFYDDNLECFCFMYLERKEIVLDMKDQILYIYVKKFDEDYEITHL